jgi:hypothetical protein
MFDNFTKKGTQLMAIYQPYFYIIQDIRNGMYYAGSKWAQDANPNTFMTDGGYPTSSETIKELIRQYGLGNFIIRKLRIFDTAARAQDYETRFLQKVDARRHPKFYNGHNNDGALDPRKMKLIMTELYGVENCSELDWVKNKKKKTCLKNFGVEWPTQSEIVRNRMKDNNQQKYGTENVFQVEIFKDKVKQTNLQKRGVEWPMMSTEVKETRRINTLERYGVENTTQLEEVKEKIKQTCIEKYGYDSTQKVPEIREKTVITNNIRYGGNAPACSDEVKEKMKQTCIEKYGVENYSKTIEARQKSKETKINKRKRQIVDLIIEITTKKQRGELGLGKGWYQREDEYLFDIYEQLIASQE